MSKPDQLGDKFIQKKVLEDMGIPVPEEALGFYTKDHTLFFEVLNTGDGFGKLLMNVESEEVHLPDEMVEKLKAANCYSEKGFPPRINPFRKIWRLLLEEHKNKAPVKGAFKESRWLTYGSFRSSGVTHSLTIERILLEIINLINNAK